MTLINAFGEIALDTSVQEIKTEQQTTNTKLDSLIAKDYATATKQDDIITAIGDITVDIDTTLLAKESKQLPNNHEVEVSNIASTPLISGFATAIKQLPNDHDVKVTNLATIPLVDVSALAKENKQLPNNHDVNVTNQPTGFATETLQTTGNTKLDNLLTELQKKVDQTETQPVNDANTQAMIELMTSNLDVMRRIAKLTESLAVTDANQRQRVTVENITGTALGRSMTGLDSGAGVAAPNFVTAAAPGAASGTTFFQPVWVGPVDQRYQIMDQARNAYANGIRNNISFN